MIALRREDSKKSQRGGVERTRQDNSFKSRRRGSRMGDPTGSGGRKKAKKNCSRTPPFSPPKCSRRKTRGAEQPGWVEPGVMNIHPPRSAAGRKRESIETEGEKKFKQPTRGARSQETASKTNIKFVAGEPKEKKKTMKY